MRAFLLLVLLVPGSFAAAESLASRQLSFGLMVAQKGLWQEARFRFERALALDPKNAAALNDLAVSLEQTGEFFRAHPRRRQGGVGVGSIRRLAIRDGWRRGGRRRSLRWHAGRRLRARNCLHRRCDALGPFARRTFLGLARRGRRSR